MNYHLLLEKICVPFCMIFMVTLFFLGCGKQADKTGNIVGKKGAMTDSARGLADSSRMSISAWKTNPSDKLSEPRPISLDSPDVPPVGEHSLFWIAVARSDSVFFPFALYNHGKWTNPWPGDDFGERYNPADTSISTLAAIPAKWYAPLPKVPVVWYLLKPGGYSDTTQVERPAAVYEHCFQRWALVRRYSADLENPQQQNPTIKTGIALSEAQTELQADNLDSHSEMGRKVLTFIAPEFDKAEKEANIPVPDAERASTKLILLSLFRCKNSDDGYTIHLEVRKDYNRKISDDLETSEGSSVFTVWINEDAGGSLRILKQQMFLRGWHPKEFETPLGILSIAGKIYWFVQIQGYEGEAYKIYEVDSEAINFVFEVQGGGC